MNQDFENFLLVIALVLTIIEIVRVWGKFWDSKYQDEESPPSEEEEYKDWRDYL